MKGFVPGAPRLWPAMHGVQRLLLPSLFLLFSLPVLLLQSVLVPPGEVPDEVAHIARAASLLHGEVIGHRQTRTNADGRVVTEAGVTVNPGLIGAAFAFGQRDKKVTPELQADFKVRPWAPAAGFAPVPNTAVYTPTFYLPGAFGLGVAHLLHRGPYRAILAGRILNSLTYAALGLAALLLARRLRGVLFATLLLPMSLALAASFNQDGLMIASSVLAAALLTRGTPASYWAAGAILAAVIAAKPPYIPLALVMGVVPAAYLGRNSRLQRLGGVALAGLPALAWTALAQSRAMVPFERGEAYHPGPLWPGDPSRVFLTTDPSAQLQVLLHRPLLGITLPLQELQVWWEGHLQQFVGYLGLLDTPLPDDLYTLWYAAILAVLAGEAFGARHDATGPRALQSLAIISLAVLSAWLVYIAQYLSWTPVGNAMLEGVQGRYFIPLLPVLGLAVPRLVLPGGSVLRHVLRVPAVAAAGAGMVAVPVLTVMAYYMR